MKQLTKKQKIFVLKEMIRYYGNSIEFDVWAMCNLMREILRHDLKYPDMALIDLKLVFPEFYDGKTIYNLWYPTNDKKSRLTYCTEKRKLIESK